MQKAPWQRTVTLMMVTQFLAAVGFSTVFPFLPAYVEQLGSRSGTTVFWVSAVFSGQAFAMMIASPIWGAVSDRYGRKPMLIRALVGGAVLVFLMGLARSSEELFWLRVIQGLVTGVVSAASSMAASVTPRDRLGYSMGLMQTGQWAGIAIGPVLGGVLSYAVGIRYSFMVTAVLLLAGGLIVMLGVKEDFVPPANRQRGVGGMFRQWGAVLTAKGVSLTYILRFTAWLGRTMIMPFLPLFIASLTVRQDLAGLYTGLTIGVSSLAATYSGIVLGRLGDKVGHKRLLIVSALATALFYVPMTFATAVWQVVLFNTLIGFAVGGVLPAISALLARYTDPSIAGSVYGIDNSVGAASRAFSPLLAAAILAATSGGGTPNYALLFPFTAALFVVTALLGAWRLPSGDTDSEIDGRSQSAST
ncbi:MAG: MFS transporter [Trueperaceae bacterium]|nr:MFS transporter [Trueperaceae bacterium]